MQYISKRIIGQPIAFNVGYREKSRKWTKSVSDQTRDLPSVDTACLLRITFFLPASSFNRNLPCGSDLDNLLKPFFDGLKQTVFLNAPGGDSCVVALEVAKARAQTPQDAGALIEIFPINAPSSVDR
jgi:Holliday junction resolvase RusA-like endonuclease